MVRKLRRRNIGSAGRHGFCAHTCSRSSAEAEGYSGPNIGTSSGLIAGVERVTNSSACGAQPPEQGWARVKIDDHV